MITKCANGNSVENWYDDAQKSSVSIVIDPEGNQIGEAAYSGNKITAASEREGMITANGGRAPLLHKLTRDALAWKRQIADDTYDELDPETECWLDVSNACREALRLNTPACMPKDAQEELENYLQGDLPPAETTAIVRDLCRAGWYEKHDPSAVTTRKIKTRTVDGVKYSTGF